MQYSQTNKPSILNLDKSPQYLTPEESFYLLNNDSSSEGEGELGVNTPLGANYLACEMELPMGENHTAGSCYDAIVNEEYSWTYNPNGAHFISRIKSDGECEVVYDGECLNILPNPKNKITKNRSLLHINRLCHKVKGGILKQLIWIDGNSDIYCLDVEASIATNNFTTPFFDVCTDDCAMIQLCVPQPKGCLHGKFIPKTENDKGLTNFILDKGIKVMFKFEYYDGRQSEWSDRSTLFFQDAKGCFDSEEGYARTIEFDVPLGNPMVDKIHIAVSEDGGATYFLYDTIQKYQEYVDGQFWYERGFNSDLEVDFENCTFKYLFSNDRERTPIAPAQVNRVYNPQPRKPQCILPMPKGAIGYVNYEKGNCPLPKKEAEKIRINVECTENDVKEPEMVEVKVRAIIYNFYFANHDPQTLTTFGIIYSWNNKGISWGVPIADAPFYDQKFAEDKVENFTAYIEGTELKAEMKQYLFSGGFRRGSFVGTIKGGTSILDYQRGTTYQEASFFVPQGTKGLIRLSSHLTSQNTDTSTQVLGTFNIDLLNGVSLPDYKQREREIEFDTCGLEGNVLDLSRAFVIEDLYTTGSGKTSSAYSGYVRDIQNLPYEGAIISTGGGINTVTDHNGYFAFYKFDGNPTMEIIAKGEVNCGDFQEIGKVVANSGEKQMGYGNINVSPSGVKTWYMNVKATAQDCNGNPIAGQRVAITGGKFRVSGDDGVVTFPVRNYYTRDRIVKVIAMDKGNCFTINCDGDLCMPSASKLLRECFVYPLPLVDIYEDDLGELVLNTEGAVRLEKGLKSGGRYPFGFVLEGSCGRISAVNKINYLEIPKIQEKKSLSFCDLSFSIDPSITLPEGIDEIKLVRGENVNSFVLSWVVDKVERNVNGNIKLTLQSLNDYNAFYNFKSNTVYKFVENDRVEFIKNGDGKYFPSDLNFKILSPYNDTIVSGVTDSPADFFNQILVQDNSKLSNLKEGAVIQILRSKEYSDAPAYYEICATIPVVDGKPLITSGTFETFDTYLVSRKIGKFAPQIFEHNKPTDFYNSIIADDRGKAHFVNDFENEKRYGRNITIASANQINYFGDLEKTFDCAEHGDIVGINLKDEKIGLAISENDNSLFSVADDLLRIGSDNVVRAATADQLISNPQPKISGTYGCSYEDVNSIFFGDGYALWVDSNVSDFIIHNYQEAKIAGAKLTQSGIETSCSSYFRKRIREKENFNRQEQNEVNKLRYAIGLDKRKGFVYLTLKAWNHAGINNSKSVYALPNETIIFNPKTNNYLGFASFTPEDYSFLELQNFDGCSFITYQNSMPFIHPLIPDKWNEFFGVACDWIVGTVLNKGAEKIKIPIAIELQSDTMFYVAEVTSQDANFRSEIPPVKWKASEADKWNGSFLKNINSRGGLYEGEKAKGYFFKVLFVRDNTLNLAYNSKNEDKMTAFSQLNLIIFKFLVVEQSGFTQNL